MVLLLDLGQSVCNNSIEKIEKKDKDFKFGVPGEDNLQNPKFPYFYSTPNKFPICRNFSFRHET